MARDGLVAIGSRGQTRLHPALAELRQSRALVLKMLDGLKLPQDSGVIRSGGTSHCTSPPANRPQGPRNTSSAMRCSLVPVSVIGRGLM